MTTFDRTATSTAVDILLLVPSLDKFFSPPTTINSFDKLIEALNVVFDYRVSANLEVLIQLPNPNFESLDMCSSITQETGKDLQNKVMDALVYQEDLESKQ